MKREHQTSRKSHLVWVYPGVLADALDAATWLDTTAELRGMGWRVTLISVGPARPQLCRGVEILCIPRPEIYLVRQIVYHLRVIRFLLQRWATIDVVLFHQMSLFWLLPLKTLRLCLGRKRPLFVMDTRTVHMPPVDRATWKDRLHKSAYQLANHLANRWADGHLAITRRMADSVRIPAEKLWGIWPSGVDVERFAPAQTKRRWPSPEEPIQLIYIGCQHYERNLMTLSRAVVRARAEGMDLILLLVGDGAEHEDLERFAAQADGGIRVTPAVPHMEVPDTLAQAHVGVISVPDEEKFRVSNFVKLFEYMAAGLPVLTTRIVSVTDVIGNGQYAFWIEDADEEGILAGLRLVWEDRNRLSERADQAATAAQGWTWHESAKKLKAALEYGLREHG